MNPWALHFFTLWTLGGYPACDAVLVRLNLTTTDNNLSLESMGDTNAVTVLELAHHRDVAHPRKTATRGPEFGDVYSDDSVLFSILHMSHLHELRNCPQAKRAEQMYSDKSETVFKAEFWGGALDGISGSLGFPMQRRVILMYVLGVTRRSLQQTLGAWIFALSFKREARCCLDVAFMCARKLPTRNLVPACGALLDDLLLAEGRSSSRKLDHVLRKLAYECLASSLTIDLLWVPSTWRVRPHGISLWNNGAAAFRPGPRNLLKSSPLPPQSRNHSVLMQPRCSARVSLHRQTLLATTTAAGRGGHRASSRPNEEAARTLSRPFPGGHPALHSRSLRHCSARAPLCST